MPIDPDSLYFVELRDGWVSSDVTPESKQGKKKHKKDKDAKKDKRVPLGFYQRKREERK